MATSHRDILEDCCSFIDATVGLIVDQVTQVLPTPEKLDI